jgi:phospholipase C
MGLFHRVTNRDTADPIQHVIVLVLENHSFDQMLGSFKSVFPNLDGVGERNPSTNIGVDGRRFTQRPSFDPIVDPDPMHEVDHVARHLENNNGGFVAEYQREYRDRADLNPQRIMDYFEVDSLPALHTLARHFTICDRWFSSVPGPTWTNRFFIHSGTSLGIVDMPKSVADTDLYLNFHQETIFDRLNERGIKWRVYFGDVPNSLVLSHQRHPTNAMKYRPMRSFYSNCAEPADHFPQYSFIEPNYMKGEQNDDHPAHATMRAQRLIANVYNAIRSNDALWKSCLLLIIYDEHGGFYDHVPPPDCVPPDNNVGRFPFNRLGVRVPALLVSPWVAQQVVKTEFDHTSLLRY